MVTPRLVLNHFELSVTPAEAPHVVLVASNEIFIRLVGVDSPTPIFDLLQWVTVQGNYRYKGISSNRSKLSSFWSRTDLRG